MVAFDGEVNVSAKVVGSSEDAQLVQEHGWHEVSWSANHRDVSSRAHDSQSGSEYRLEHDTPRNHRWRLYLDVRSGRVESWK